MPSKLHEVITLNQIIGGILVLFSVYMINKEESVPPEDSNLLISKNLSEELAFRNK